ncbi:hypothetical protein PT974_11437 [Cladobotryum mycophilum]|uniref:Uncharacterized protein n=1 Tax=Cladobotryum mycophilum TaxID=491253 RepID=A0ABR0S579_9HYPO
MPALTINTENTTSRPPSPSRPPVSPITPVLGPARLPGDGNGNGGSSNVNNVNRGQAQAQAVTGTSTQQEQQRFARQTFTHSQPDQIVAIKATISALQVQKIRATNDMQALSKAKNEALENSEAFLRDLVSGRVRQTDGFNIVSDDGPAWSSLPKQQDVLRCPPINWSQYGVVGESLDKLHAEQVARPTEGTPAAIGSGGMYEFKGGDGKQERYGGVAAPFSPLKDKIEKKPRGKK